MSDEQSKTVYWKAFQRRRDSFQNFGVQIFRKTLLGLLAPVIDGVRKSLPNPEELINEDAILKPYRLLYSNVVAHFGAISFERTGKSFFVEMDRKRFINGVEVPDPIWEEIVNAFLAKESGARIAGVNQASKNAISKILQQAINEGLGIEETVDLLTQKWKNVSTIRALRIARTEIITASNLGSLEGAKATGLPLRRQWLATRDGRVRDDHAAADGQQIPIDSNYVIGGELLKFPGDPAASGANTINCRCTETYEVV